MSPVDFKKWPCHPVEFNGQGPPGAGSGGGTGALGWGRVLTDQWSSTLSERQHNPNLVVAWQQTLPNQCTCSG